MLFVWIVLGLMALSVAGLVYLYRRPLPQVSGVLNVKGLRAPVEIVRDRWGVPHIYAQNLEDLFFAQGYVHAQDRLWQMELNRRISHGRLAEIFGEMAFDTDSLVRRLGFSRAAQADLAGTDAETRGVLEAYARGVNAYVEANPGRLPLEFSLLGFRPSAWQPLDSLVWGKMQAWALSANWASEVLRAALIGKLGVERAAQLQGEYSPDNPIIMPGHTYAAAIEQVLAQFRAAEPWLPLPGLGGMSNNWVVDGAKSATGKPLLANDPHVSLQMPAVWYENHLISPELQVTGVTFPSTPGVVIGHNADIAWGVTNSFADVQDLYVERFDPDDPTRYEYRGGWEQATLVREEIRVKGEAEPRVIQVVITRHGPIINALLAPAARLGLASARADPQTGPQAPLIGIALKWTAHEESQIQRAILRINRARDWAEFDQALRDWGVPSQHFVYADRAGNIGYSMPGRIPIRAQGIGAVPAPGWTGEYEWVGWIPHEDLPHAFNPAQHYFVTANNQVVGKEYPHFLTAETQNGFRARRIVDLLTEKDKLTADDFARIQVDMYCAPARPFCELLTALSPALLDHPALGDVRDLAGRALDLVKGWDYRLSAGSAAGGVYKAVQYFAMRRVFEPWLGDLTEHYMGKGFHPVLSTTMIAGLDYTPLVVQRILINDESQWFQDGQGQAVTRVDILALALKDAVTHLRRAVGEDVTQWQWGRVHPASFNHPLGAQKPLDKIFSRGPYPYGGDASTVWQSGYVPHWPIQADGSFSVSWRQIMDLGDWDASRAILTTGQSGHPASRHYDDMIPLWLAGEYHPLLWTRDKIEAQAEARLRLEPRPT